MNRIKERCIAALHQRRQVADDFVLDQVTALMAGRPVPPLNPQEMRERVKGLHSEHERVKELRRECEENIKAWQKQLLYQGLLRLAVLLIAAMCLAVFVRFGNVGALAACALGVIACFYRLLPAQKP